MPTVKSVISAIVNPKDKSTTNATGGVKVFATAKYKENKKAYKKIKIKKPNLLPLRSVESPLNVFKYLFNIILNFVVKTGLEPAYLVCIA